MVWTAPITWSGAPTAATLNLHIRDNMAALRWGPWGLITSLGGSYGPNTTDYGAPWAPLRFRYSGDVREMELRGLVRITGTLAAGGVILTVPPLARLPANNVLAFVQHTDSGSNQHAVRLNMEADGKVHCPGEALTNCSLSVSGMRWAKDT